ncbi:MAG: S-methyl-5'-thioadenosine phosphorylase [Pseudomonadota bacterium]
MNRALIGVIGGSGLYRLDGLQNPREEVVETPFGPTSDSLRFGELNDVPLVFLARHGQGHRLLPSEVPYRANIYALKAVGVRYVISVSAVGSLVAEIAPRHVVVPNQFIDLTKHRQSTFFGDGVVAHVSMAAPISSAVASALVHAHGQHADPAQCHANGTYLCIEGPQFSSLAESLHYQALGASVIGMTNMPEAKLAREAQIAYATLALVTDYDCWHPHEANVEAASALENMAYNVALAQRIVATAATGLGTETPACEAHTALAAAVVTPDVALNARQRGLLDILRR